MAKKKPGTLKPDAATAATAATPAAGGFSLGGAGFSLGGGGGFSLDGAKSTGPITAPLPDGSRIPAGEPLAMEREDAEELEQYQEMTRDPKLSAAEFYEKKRKEKERLARVNDQGYYLGIVFATNDDLHRFLDQFDPPVELVDGWVDGYEFADAVGKPVPRTNLTDPSGNVLEQWAELALEVQPPPEPTVPDDFDLAFE